MGNLIEELNGKCRFCGSTNLTHHAQLKDDKCGECKKFQNEEDEK